MDFYVEHMHRSFFIHSQKPYVIQFRISGIIIAGKAHVNYVLSLAISSNWCTHSPFFASFSFFILMTKHLILSNWYCLVLLCNARAIMTFDGYSQKVSVHSKPKREREKAKSHHRFEYIERDGVKWHLVFCIKSFRNSSGKSIRKEKCVFHDECNEFIIRHSIFFLHHWLIYGVAGCFDWRRWKGVLSKIAVYDVQFSFVLNIPFLAHLKPLFEKAKNYYLLCRKDQVVKSLTSHS